MRRPQITAKSQLRQFAACQLQPVGPFCLAPLSLLGADQPHRSHRAALPRRLQVPQAGGLLAHDQVWVRPVQPLVVGVRQQNLLPAVAAATAVADDDSQLSLVLTAGA